MIFHYAEERLVLILENAGHNDFHICGKSIYSGLAFSPIVAILDRAYQLEAYVAFGHIAQPFDKVVDILLRR